MSAQHSMKSVEWYTPPNILDAARVAMGGEIDLDPASNILAHQQIVKSWCFISKEGDGLNTKWEWRGRVFLNPPSPPRAWWDRLVDEHSAARCDAAVYVAYSIEQLQQSQSWRRPMTSCAVCIPFKRIRFWCTAGDAALKLIAKLVKRAGDTGLDPMDVATKGERAHLEAWAANQNVLVPGDAPTHASAIVGLGMDRHDFFRAFETIGACL